MKNITTLTLGVIFMTMGLAFAQQTPSAAQKATQAVDVGNKFCPVSGRPIGVMGPGVEETYNGKIYHLCCGGCVSTFESNPEKYSKIADMEVAAKNK
jgi:YHS domain-containing protein